MKAFKIWARVASEAVLWEILVLIGLAALVGYSRLVALALLGELG